MALKQYRLKENFRAPYLRVTGNPKNPGKLCGVQYRRNDVIVGELKHAGNKPAFVLVEKNGIQLPFPINIVEEVVGKKIGDENTSGATGDEKSIINKVVSKDPKVQYLDAMIIGGLAGLGVVWFAEKRGWIALPEKKNKIYGFAIGALAGAYIVFRIKQTNKKPKE